VIDSAGGLLTGVTAAKNKASALKGQFAAPAGYKVGVFTSDGTAVADSAAVGTGMIVRLMENDDTVVDTATVVVRGDMNGDGLIQIGDITLAAGAASGNVTLTGARLAAVDFNGSGSVTVGEITQLVKMFRA
jgi:hypothetical protein